MPVDLEQHGFFSQGSPHKSWESKKDTIRRLYIEEARPLWEVHEIMMKEHDFKASIQQYKTRFKQWGPPFPKNKTRTRAHEQVPIPSGSARRTRPRRITTRLEHQRSVATSGDARLVILLPKSPRTPAVELALRSAGNYTQGLLNDFTWDNFTITSQAGRCDFAAQWQEIVDQCWGATELVLRKELPDGFNALQQMCAKLSDVVRFVSPAMMVKLWRLCYRLYKTCSKMGDGDFRLLREFLRYIRELMGHHHGNHPLCLALDAISTAPGGELRDTLRVFYLITIRAMESRLGQHHSVVLNMWSNYLKYWEGDGLDSASFIQGYQALLGTSESEFGVIVESTVTVLHGFMYAAYYNLKDKALNKHLALELHSRVPQMPCLQGVPWWSVPTQGFALAAKLLATLSLEEGQIEASWSFIENAVNRLSQGDGECQTRSRMLKGILDGWQREQLRHTQLPHRLSQSVAVASEDAV
ncbi:Clr5 domain-containing protein [Lasiosphaeria miniovina]|uniref:Clr5 domain-containing protein n=1 Tax=Lasiosphaeria miniovina TaxID=1954250 RepID=A0AA39ZSQ4_9PEZI|nr:Clr5 domain-containing protein [Lasiosphaeria miniovina]KAK0702941.1 Clr5 domain-containing protein [Lasiosphaeria miniovina]